MKKKILLSIVFVLSMLAINVFAIDGDGSEGNPFLITTQEELELISDFPDSNFKLMNDIVLEGEWVPLCTYGDSFTGVFDGSGYTISNLQITGNYEKTGLFAENNGTIKNISIETSKTGVVFNKEAYSSSYIGILSAINNGEIENCRVYGEVSYINEKYISGGSSGTSTIYGYAGGIAAQNTGIITKSSADADIDVHMYCYLKNTVKTLYGGTAYAGEITGYNSGNLNMCRGVGTVKVTSAYYSYVGGIAGRSESGFISNSYFKGRLQESAHTHGTSYLGYSGGIIGNGKRSISSCFAVSTGNKYGIGNNDVATTCFYDKDVSGLTDTTCGTPKSTSAMKMQATYTDWDFENVWGISPDINDGYPYLLWEYADDETDEPSDSVESVASISIVKAEATDDSLTMVSCVNLVGEHNIESVGTTFIPLWLFTAPDAEVLNIEHSNTEHNIVNGDTFSATITGIPEGYCDMVFVGKSYIKMTNGEYIWSTAKSASIAESTLHKVE